MFIKGDTVRVKNCPSSPIMIATGPHPQKENCTSCFWFSSSNEIIDRVFDNDLLEICKIEPTPRLLVRGITRNFEKEMNEQQVIDLMKSSKSEAEWNANCDKVKADCGGYPDFWYRAIMMSGIFAQVRASW